MRGASRAASTLAIIKQKKNLLSSKITRLKKDLKSAMKQNDFSPVNTLTGTTARNDYHHSTCINFVIRSITYLLIFMKAWDGFWPNASAISFLFRNHCQLRDYINFTCCSDQLIQVLTRFAVRFEFRGQSVLGIFFTQKGDSYVISNCCTDSERNLFIPNIQLAVGACFNGFQLNGCEGE